MGFIYLFLSIVGESAGYTIDKMNFKKNRIGFSQLMIMTFFVMTVTLFAFILISNEPIPDFTLVSLLLMGLIIVVSFGSNVFDYLSLKVDDRSLREPMIDFTYTFWLTGICILSRGAKAGISYCIYCGNTDCSLGYT